MQLHQPPLPVDSFHDSIHFQSSGVRCMDPSLSDHEQSTASFQGRRRYRNLLCKTSRLGLDGCLQRKPMLIYFQDVSVWSCRNRLKEVLATLKERGVGILIDNNVEEKIRNAFWDAYDSTYAGPKLPASCELALASVGTSKQEVENVLNGAG